MHFRLVRKDYAPAVIQAFYEAVSEFIENSSLAVMKGKKVLELTPAGPWNKGKAALMILERLGNGWLPVMIGDDVTDETAFAALRERGLTVRVGRSVKTSAQYYVKDQGEVGRFLKGLIDELRDC
jgi:trehalose-phosphatase